MKVIISRDELDAIDAGIVKLNEFASGKVSRGEALQAHIAMVNLSDQEIDVSGTSGVPGLDPDEDAVIEFGEPFQDLNLQNLANYIKIRRVVPDMTPVKLSRLVAAGADDRVDRIIAEANSKPTAADVVY